MMNHVQQLLGKTALVACDPVSKIHKRYCGSRLDKACQQGSDYIKRRSAKRQLQKEQDDFYQPFQRLDCHILYKLDQSVLLCIVDFLPLDTQAVLSQTCRAMRNILKVPAPIDLPYVERVDYLANLAKDRVDCWVCDDCVKIHKMHLADRPLSTVSGNCTRVNTDNNTSTNLFRRGMHFFLTSQHVELALKYTRLGKDNLSWKHKLYLEEVLKPRVCRDKMPDVDGLEKDVTCRIEPKVVDGRFLLRIEWTYNFKDEEKLTAQDVWRLLGRQGEECSWYEMRYSEVGVSHEGDDDCSTCHRCLSRAATKRAVENHNVDVEGHDLSSPTDYTFRVEAGKAKLIAWQDIGKGVSPIDLAWTRTVLTQPDDDWEGDEEEDEPVDLRIGHGPGDVRCLFESN
ncbi:uncharacterized protein NECHADRAFT_74098 [Fusarium vanettenii 77-13-4]|uniref:F-box domain-containing protein n=1 Tax=Fusarium vanettenii (strain ATCC MYA-4622 / CBS 123669 / FGSC 9596 / NRRL 45880 / 77-13-4) TaxID=660122 RepID=C7YVW3_FUSV7|nr:uncharacterized protein NECHADRAFT_74098 [Fusarium vanettenii 77-13-4]EEU43859.1 predicted protein [Fusarium vanettenii 77-13-4]